MLGHEGDDVWLAYCLSHSDWQGIVGVGLRGIFLGYEQLSLDGGEGFEDGGVGYVPVH